MSPPLRDEVVSTREVFNAMHLLKPDLQRRYCTNPGKGQRAAIPAESLGFALKNSPRTRIRCELLFTCGAH